MSEDKNSSRRFAYWKVILAGIVYILLLGLFTYLFNNPV